MMISSIIGAHRRRKELSAVAELMDAVFLPIDDNDCLLLASECDGMRIECIAHGGRLLAAAVARQGFGYGNVYVNCRRICWFGPYSRSDARRGLAFAYSALCPREELIRIARRYKDEQNN